MKLGFRQVDAAMRKSYGAATLKEWEAMDTAPFINKDNEWDSVYRLKLSRKLDAKSDRDIC